MAQGMFVTPGKDYGSKIEAIESSVDRLAINALLTDLKLAVNSSNIDAWCDLLGNTNMINTGASSGYSLVAGSLSCAAYLSQLTGSTQYTLTASTEKYAQTFTTFSDISLGKVILRIKKLGTPVDTVGVQIYATSGGIPTTLIATSDTTYANADLTTGSVEKPFYFNSGVALLSGVMYAIVFYRTGFADSTNTYSIAAITPTAYSGGTFWQLQSGIWQDQGYDAYFQIFYFEATVIWNGVTASEVLEKMAVASSQTLGTGTITWYLSDDGTNWVEIEDLNIMYETSFDATSVYLKCVLTGDASVDAVAWGGM